jgi:hypothetical protein
MRILLRFLQNHLPKISINIVLFVLVLPLFISFQLFFEDSYQISLHNFLVKIVFDHPTFFQFTFSKEIKF